MAGNVSGQLAFGATALGAVLYGLYKQSQSQTAGAKGDAKDSKSAAAAGAGAGAGATNQTASASAGAAAAGGAAPLTAAQMAELKPLVEQWLLWDPNPNDRAAVAKLWGTGDLAGRNGDAQALYRAFCPRISFGTAGLRARMAPGYAQMNDLVVTQTSQGLCRYAQREFPEGKAQAMGAVIGYDGRHNSKRFAEITAAVFLSQGFRVWLFRELAMTPIVPFSVLQYGAAVGVMVTASHNPKQDNGYKVYWANGAQIIQPRDAHISALIQQNLQPWADVKFDLAHANLLDPTKAMGDKYMDEIGKRYCWTRAANATSQLHIAYTAMHGVGHAWIRRAFAAFGLPPLIPTKEQVEPDPDFPTVEFPNPEEGKGALALAMRTADANGCPVILANDPDADRLAVAEKDLKTGEWRVLNGNQIGVLFADYVWQQYVAREKPTAEQKAKALMLASTVSSKMLKAMAKAEGFTFWGTLTGFKWMGNVAQHAITPAGGAYNFLFAYEVEIGFLVGDLSLDKDGVRTGAIFAELAGALYAKGSTLWEHLQELYARYGYFQMNNSYYFCYSPPTMDKIFARLRSMGPGGSYPNTCGPYRIVSVRDVTLGIDTGKPGGKAVVPTVPDAQMLTFRFENGGTCTLRGSGTEPKLKFYVECDSKISERTAQALLSDMTKFVVSEFLRPELNALVARKVL